MLALQTSLSLRCGDVYIQLNKGYAAGEDLPSTPIHALKVMFLKVIEYKELHFVVRKAIFGIYKSDSDAETRVRRDLSVCLSLCAPCCPLLGVGYPMDRQ